MTQQSETLEIAQRLRKLAAGILARLPHADGQNYYEDKRRAADMQLRADQIEQRSAREQKDRQRSLAKIHMAKKALGMDDHGYRAMLNRVAKVKSARDLTALGRMQVLAEVKRLGWRPKRTRKYSPQSRDKPKHAKTMVDKIRALWIQLHRDGIVHDGSEKALGKFAERMTGKYTVDWLDEKEQWRVLEALKKWLARGS